ncbi:MAG: VCBS repeat-containing protein, partial [Bacteroidota bacterium]
MTQTLRTVLLWLAVPLITSPVVGQSLFQLRSPQETGVDFVNEITEDAKRNIIRYQGYYDGGGVALADFNNDGLLDLFFTGNSSPNRLYVNRGNLRFEEVTASSGLRETGPGWFTGVSLVDVNQDGWMDLYVCKSGLFDESNRRNKLYVNNGDLTFTEQAADYGLDHAGYSTQAVFFDYDRDNDLDVYLTNYGKPDPSQVLTSAPQMRRQRDPHGGDKLLENVDGRYQDVSQQAGIYEHTWGFAHSAGVGDFNRDGWPDLFVSNDFTEHDFVYLNNQQGGFEERGASVLRHMSNFSMGNDVADFNNDGLPDLVVVDMVAEDNKRLKENMSGMQRDEFQRFLDLGYHYQYMFNMLHLNTGAGEFSDIAHLAGISNTDWSWAPLFADFDNDGWKDLYITNGLRRDARNQDARYVFVDLVNQAEQAGRTALTEAEWMKALDAMPSEKLTNYVYRNVNGLRFENRVEAWGLDVASFSNGAAYGDLDNDGDLDLVVNNINDPAFVYENVGGAGKNYLKVALQGPAGNRHGLGAEVSIWARGEQQLMINQWTRGYRSAMAGALHFGLGDAGTVDSVQVKWPDGRVTLAERIPANSTLVVEYTPATVSPRSKAIPKPFSSVDNIAQPAYRHSENLFDDFNREVLLPHTLSALGPFSAVGDVNGDGLEDFYIGGAMGRAGSLYLQQANATFQIKYLAAFNRDAGFEDMGSHFFDCDQDGDLDLYVVSGGNEQALGDGKYQDRLYLNDGSGSYSHSDGLTEMDFSGS